MKRHDGMFHLVWFYVFTCCCRYYLSSALVVLKGSRNAVLLVSPKSALQLMPTSNSASGSTTRRKGFGFCCIGSKTYLSGSRGGGTDDGDNNVDDQQQQQQQQQRRRSRLEGNQREATPREIAIMDDMITKLMYAKPYELPGSVSRAFRVVSTPRFFLRIAERVDMATSEEERLLLKTLADNITSTLAAVVSTAQDKLDECAEVVETIVTAAAEPDSGEFLVPLSQDRFQSMQNALKRVDPSALNEGFLSTVDAYMNKSMQDGLDGMVAILQKVLQLYAGTQISRARTQLQSNVAAALRAGQQPPTDHDSSSPPAAAAAVALFEDLLQMDSDRWDAELQRRMGSEVSKSELMGEVQRTIEGVVLGLESGSMAQRVQAEYLRELSTRIEAV
jgi:hypothetical protein